jgi:glycosyltransferase involved in cell wall biosynthesis
MSRRLRILEVIDRPFLGGGQVTVLNLARGLDRDEFEVAIACGGEGPLVGAAERIDVRRVAVAMGKSRGAAPVGELAAVMKRESFDVVHTHGGVAGLYGRLAARRVRGPAVVHTLHGIHYLHYRNPVLKRGLILLERRLSRTTDAVVVVSEADERRALRLRLAAKEKVKLIRNGVAPPALPAGFDPVAKRRELGLRDGPLAGAVSRLHRQKGLIHLVRAAALFGTLVPEAVVAVVGGGPLRESLEKETRKWGLGNRFRFLGERADAPEILACFDVFVLPSLWEGLPYALVEAAAAGRPIAATAIDGVLEVVRDGETGLLVPPADPEALSGAVLRLLGDPELAGKLGRAARETIPPRFGMDNMIRETSALYRNLVSRGPG